MKRRTSILGLIAGLMLAGSLLAQAALAQPPDETTTGNNSTSVSVTFFDNGVFDAYFCAPSLPITNTSSASLSVQSPPTLTSAGYATGTLAICYNDTKLYRPSFDVYLQSTDFTSGPNSIAASNFTIETSYNVGQQFYGNAPIDYGDIGEYINDGGIVAQSDLPEPWTFDNSLDVARLSQFGYSGVGTGVSLGAFDVKLVLPVGKPAGTYQSTLSLTINASDQP